MNIHNYNTQELWDIIKRPNLCFHRVEEEADTQTKGIGNLFNELLVENFPNLGNDIYVHVLAAFQPPNRHNQKRQTPHHIKIKMQRLKNKEKILKAEEKNISSHTKVNTTITSNLSL
jgi:hypothetical protein